MYGTGNYYRTYKHNCPNDVEIVDYWKRQKALFLPRTVSVCWGNCKHCGRMNQSDKNVYNTHIKVNKNV